MCVGRLLVLLSEMVVAEGLAAQCCSVVFRNPSRRGEGAGGCLQNIRMMVASVEAKCSK